MAKILLIRFSAIGDVAMTVPVIYSFAKRYPQHHITVLSRRALMPLFAELPSNVSFWDADISGRHSGLRGLYALYKELSAENFDFIADLHDVLRTKYLRFCFCLAGKRVACIKKGRWEKEALTRKRNKKFHPLKSSFQRYQDVLSELGFSFPIQFESIYPQGKGDFSKIESVIGKQKGKEKWIGIAPFAKHQGKIYPIELQEEVVAYFAAQKDVRVFLFGGGKAEKEVFDGWVRKYPTLTSTVGLLNMGTELILISHLDVMLSMDSANMHLASLVHTPVVSVWGATHPYAGFMGWNQSVDNTVQLPLSCRPCSVFGNKPCWRGDYACLCEITPAQVIQKVESIIEDHI